MIIYIVCFSLTYCWCVYNRLTLSLNNPSFYLNELDITTNLLIATNIPKLLITTKWLAPLMDTLYLSVQIILAYLVLKEKKTNTIFVFSVSFVNLIYALLLSMTSHLSIQQFLPWILLPLIFANTKIINFYYNFHSIRLVFITVFFSAALWKLFRGTLFNSDEMASILLWQHSIILTSDSQALISKCFMYLINHKYLSQGLYLLAFLAEFVFLIGFFTKKFDKLLLILLCLFIAADYSIMFINYFSWTAFIILFLYSKKEINKDLISTKN